MAHNFDEHVAQLIEMYSPQDLVDINVHSDFENMIDKTHLSPRGKGRNRNSTEIIKLQKLPFIAISEPFHSSGHLANFKRIDLVFKLGESSEDSKSDSSSSSRVSDPNDLISGSGLKF
ncbi:hypothetical protein H5410_003374 [Solanum commersonii]|uniref:Uncharacterized protein n=1 Tax=Solanum commersonii TaxID=4109 RepID=A0A9J6B4N3_SOLCO|nr:hypothetical protein H5410_003374 [Solanum commersonii]